MLYCKPQPPFAHPTVLSFLPPPPHLLILANTHHRTDAPSSRAWRTLPSIGFPISSTVRFNSLQKWKKHLEDLRTSKKKKKKLKNLWTRLSGDAKRWDEMRWLKTWHGKCKDSGIDIVSEFLSTFQRYPTESLSTFPITTTLRLAECTNSRSQWQSKSHKSFSSPCSSSGTKGIPSKGQHT